MLWPTSASRGGDLAPGRIGGRPRWIESGDRWPLPGRAWRREGQLLDRNSLARSRRWRPPAPMRSRSPTPGSSTGAAGWGRDGLSTGTSATRPRPLDRAARQRRRKRAAQSPSLDGGTWSSGSRPPAAAGSSSGSWGPGSTGRSSAPGGSCFSTRRSAALLHLRPHDARGVA
jgi:hypothetical protein